MGSIFIIFFVIAFISAGIASVNFYYGERYVDQYRKFELAGNESDPEYQRLVQKARTAQAIGGISAFVGLTLLAIALVVAIQGVN